MPSLLGIPPIPDETVSDSKLKEKSRQVLDKCLKTWTSHSSARRHYSSKRKDCRFRLRKDSLPTKKHLALLNQN